MKQQNDRMFLRYVHCKIHKIKYDKKKYNKRNRNSSQRITSNVFVGFFVFLNFKKNFMNERC